MDDFWPYVLLGGLAVLLPASVLVLVYAGSRGRLLRRALREAPRVKVCNVRHGQVVRLVGRLGYAVEPLQAPLSGRPCAAWHVVVTIEQRDGEHVTTDVIDDHRTQEFLITDDTGTAIVRPEFAEILITHDERHRTGSFDLTVARHDLFLRSHGHSSGFGKSIRYREGVLEEGEMVAAYGRGRWEQDPRADASAPTMGYRGGSRRLVLLPPIDDAMILSDDPDTVVDPADSKRR